MTEERKPHRNADVLKAIAEGKEIEYSMNGKSHWLPFTDLAVRSFAELLLKEDEDIFFRVKPESAVLYIGLQEIDTDPMYTLVFTWVQHCKNVVKITFDKESEKVLSVELVK
jgi:hypothetical protein